MKRAIIKYLLLPLNLLILLIGCDIYRPQKVFKLAVPNNDYYYSYVASHLKIFLENHGYTIEIINTRTNFEANSLIAQGKADLCLINNHSIGITEAMGIDAGKLRTIAPISTRLLFAFSKNLLHDSLTVRQLLNHKVIGIEMLGGEAQQNLERFLSAARIYNSKFSTQNEESDVVLFWGTFYGSRASGLLEKGWHPYSFEKNWIDFITLNDPALRPYTLPAIPGDEKSIPIHTIATEALLVTSKSIGENAIFELSRTIHMHKLELMHKDIMYRTINEHYNQESLLYPVHEGTVSYLLRDQPTFFERYADTIALVFSILAVFYGGIQTIRGSIARRKKDQVDKYFLEFLDIRQNEEPINEKVKKLDNLFQRAVEQLTNEKLDKSDFHILSRLIQQELTMLSFSK